MKQPMLIAAALAGSLAACDGTKIPAITPAPPITQAPPMKQLDQPVQHVFVVFLENHTYDNYFAAYPNPDGDAPTTSGSTSDGRSVPLVEPASDTWSPGDNSWDVAHADFASGQMNGFDQKAHQPSVTGQIEDDFFAASGPDAAYVSYAPTVEAGRRRVGYYWFLADQGVLCDRFFSSLMGPSWPNHFYSVASTSGGVIDNAQLSGDLKLLDPATGARFEEKHLGPDRVPHALPASLEQSGLCWTAFQEVPDDLIEDFRSKLGMELTDALEKIDVVTALPDYKQRSIKTPDLEKRLPEYLAKGWGAHVTWIKPDDFHSEHPVVGSIQDGQKWTRKILDAIGTSDLWAHSVVFITWDDYGGFYDHVPPPQADSFGYGFRVPCLVVSPFAKKGVVQHQVRSHDSIVRFCERIYNLGPMYDRDAHADDFSEAFDFEQTPRPYTDFVPGQ